jgi:endonuclease YncB( thermonuclease family)
MRYRVLVVSWVILLAVLLLPGLTLAAEIQGRVVGVHDGDTFTLLQAGNQQTKIRLAEVDSPESKLPYGNKAKQELSGLIFGKTVTVAIQDTDRYGRTVGRVYANSLGTCMK